MQSMVFRNKKIEELELELSLAKEIIKHKEDEIEGYRWLLKDPANYIEALLKRGIEWFDYHKMERSLWSTYYADAQIIANGEVFNNELNHYIADLIKFAANETKDFSAVMNVRTAIVALETFKKRLEDIENPLKPLSNVDKFNPL